MALTAVSLFKTDDGLFTSIWRPMIEQGDHGRSTLIPVLQEAEFSRRGPQRPRPRWGNSLEARRLWPEPSQIEQEMCELHNKEARPSLSNEGPKSPPSCAGRRGGMRPGRVAPNGGTRTQGGAVQIDSEQASAGSDCERADCDTNSAASLKEARVNHSEGGVCVTSIQGGVERRNSNISASI